MMTDAFQPRLDSGQLSRCEDSQFHEVALKPGFERFITVDRNGDAYGAACLRVNCDDYR